MKRELAVIGGGALGLALAGVVAPLIIVFLPPAWRAERVVWSTVAVLVACAATTGWFVSGRRWRR